VIPKIQSGYIRPAFTFSYSNAGDSLSGEGILFEVLIFLVASVRCGRASPLPTSRFWIPYLRGCRIQACEL